MGVLATLGRVVAIMPRRRYLPDVIAEPHAICTGESVAAALQRITTHEFTAAIDALDDPEIDLDVATRIAASSLGRIAALLRLVRPAIGRDTCRTELGVIGEVTAFLDGLTVGRDEIRSLDELRLRYDAALRPEALSELREQLVHRHQLMRLEQLGALREGGSLPHWVHQLRRARARFAAWPVDQAIHGQRPVADSFDAVAEGLERTYRKGRTRAARAAEADPGRDVGKWHRHARDLAYQIELMSGAWPDVLAGTVATADDLAEVLDEHARIGALRSAVASGPDAVPALAVDDVTAALVESLCDHERRELMSVASVLATRLYAEKPAAFVDRLGRYWSTRP